MQAKSIVAFAIVIAAIVFSTTATFSTSYATTGMSDCKENPDNEDCNPQPDRVGNDDDTDTDADRDGPGGAGGNIGQDPGDTDDDPDTPQQDEANCWGKVSAGLAQNDDGKPGLGEHSSDPVPGDDDNETPREGVGNQREGHPSDHADTVGGLANPDPDCVD